MAAKCDTGNILDIFGKGNKIAITDPVYPVYVDTNVMIGNTGDADENGAYAGLHVSEVQRPTTASFPRFPSERVDLVYLCYPNNPTGATATRAQLEAWVQYALRTTTPSSSTTRPTRPSSRTQSSHAASSRSKARAIAPSSSAASPRTVASPACAAPSS